MTFPTIHLNGTSPEGLLKDLEIAHGAVVTAIDKLHLTAPNARDYYPQGAGAFPQAQDEYFKRLEALNTVERELTQIMEHLLEQKNWRRRR